MSLQTGISGYNYISQYSKYSPGTAETSMQSAPVTNSDDGQISIVGSSGEAETMKRIGEVGCLTCQNRKYVDGSDDPGVSFKAPTHVSPESSAAAVMAHEQEHVSRENSKAQASGRKVISQSVQIYTDICPECGRVYTSGGKTTTTTKSDNKPDYFMDNMRKSIGNHFGKYIDVKI
ncbi:MAG: hypothetical protein APF77_20000 [Clostridia bacterium BRH_c25]|nr:MAG: hypothetical protein APF77_20000 [Clostridia bacterium BRH_c25]